jgi:hypothetical protein
MAPINEKKCAECSALIAGRIDKRFCSDQCRSTFNNRLTLDDTKLIRNTNNVLRRNRRILLSLSQGGVTMIHRHSLQTRGFDFEYFTSSVRTKAGKRFFYCYDQGYIRTRKGYVQLVIKNEHHDEL